MVGAFAPVFAGCATFEGSVASGLPINKVVDRIQCEMRDTYDALKQHHPWLKNWAGAFNLSFQLDEARGIKPGLDYITPTAAGRFVAGVDFDLHDRTRRALNVKRTIRLKDFDSEKFKKSQLENPCEPPANVQSPLLGELGLKAALTDALMSRDNSDIAGESPDLLTYRVDFTLGYGVSGGPTWIFRRVTGLGFGADLSSERIHTIDFAFTDNSPRPTPRVFVVNVPAAKPEAPQPVPPALAPSRGTSPVQPQSQQRTPRIVPDAADRLNYGLQGLKVQGLEKSFERPLR